MFVISEPDMIEDFIAEEDCLDSLEKLLIASFLTEYWENNKTDMMFDREICIFLTEGNFSLGHANPFSMDLSVTKVTTRLQTGMIENEILCQLMTMRSKRTGELFKQDIYDSECGSSGDIFLRVVVELWKDY